MSEAPVLSTGARAWVWRPGYLVDLSHALVPLCRGTGDPTSFVDDSGAFWRGLNTPEGPATLWLRAGSGKGAAVVARAWGAGAAWALSTVPGLLGIGDSEAGFTAQHEPVQRARRRIRGLRLTATGQVWDVLLPAVLEQKVTNREAWRSWRQLCRRFGTRAPGTEIPSLAGRSAGSDTVRQLRELWVPPSPGALAEIRDWEWHQAGVDGARRHTLRAAASVAGQLERAVSLRGVPGRKLLQQVPGIGPWTSAEIAQRAWADPDAVSIGDYHLPSLIGLALSGRETDDAGMLELLEPYAGHRQRAVRYLLAAGVPRVRKGPRMPARDYRAL